jgi:hypothetical protein
MFADTIGGVEVASGTRPIVGMFFGEKILSLLGVSTFASK